MKQEPAYIGPMPTMVFNRLQKLMANMEDGQRMEILFNLLVKMKEKK